MSAEAYWKLHRLQDITDLRKLYDVFGVISESSHVIGSYDVLHSPQDQYRLKLRSYNENDDNPNHRVEIDMTIYAGLGFIPEKVLTVGRILQAHRFSPRRFRSSNSIYLQGRVDPASYCKIAVYELIGDKCNVVYKSGHHLISGNKEDTILKDLAPVSKQLIPRAGPPPRQTNGDDFLAPAVEEERIDAVVEPVATVAVTRSPVRFVSASPKKRTQTPARQLLATVDDVNNDVDDLVNQIIQPEAVEDPPVGAVAEEIVAGTAEDPVDNEAQVFETEREPGSTPALRTSQPSRSNDALEFDPPKVSLDETVLESARKIEEVEFVVNEKRVEMFKNVKKTGYYTIACQVVTAYSHNRLNYSLLRVWDGTRTRIGIRSTKIHEAYDYVYRFGNKDLEGKIDDDDLMYNIVCYDANCDSSLQLRKGDLVILQNIEVHHSTRSATNFILTLHGDSSNKIIKVVSSHAIYKVLKAQIDDAVESLSDAPNVDMLEPERIAPAAVVAPGVDPTAATNPPETPVGYNQRLRIGCPTSTTSVANRGALTSRPQEEEENMAEVNNSSNVAQVNDEASTLSSNEVFVVSQNFEGEDDDDELEVTQVVINNIQKQSTPLKPRANVLLGAFLQDFTCTQVTAADEDSENEDDEDVELDTQVLDESIEPSMGSEDDESSEGTSHRYPLRHRVAAIPILSIKPTPVHRARRNRPTARAASFSQTTPKRKKVAASSKSAVAVKKSRKS